MGEQVPLYVHGHIKLELDVLRIILGLRLFRIQTLQTLTKTNYSCKKQMFVKLKFRIFTHKQVLPVHMESESSLTPLRHALFKLLKPDNY